MVKGAMLINTYSFYENENNPVHSMNRSNSFTNPAPGLGDCFLSNILSLKVQIVEAILNHLESFISAARQLVKIL